MSLLAAGGSAVAVEILDFPHPKPVRHLYGELSHKEGGALTAHYGSESSPSLILGMLAIEMARRGRGMGLALLATYALSRYKLTGNDKIFFWLITNRMAPQ